MYTTGNTANMVLPYWNEIKNWSREDRSNLAELIQMSLYDEEDGNDDLINQLSPELMKELAEYAVKEHHAGRCLTQEQVENLSWRLWDRTEMVTFCFRTTTSRYAICC